MAAPQRTLMRWTISTSLKFRHLVLVIGALVMAVGVVTLPSNRVDAFPEFAPPRVVIQTACLGLSTSDVEQLVTVPLEQAFNGIDGLDVMRSKSVPQLSQVELFFKQDADLLHSRQLVSERMALVASTLPTWAAPPVMLAPVSATGRAMQIGMTAKDHSLLEMSTTAYWTIRARLLAVPGVANVAIWNERLQDMTVQIVPTAMQQHDVSLDQVMQATADAVDSGLLRFSAGSVIGTGGIVETANQRLPVRNVLPIVTPADLAQVPVDTGAPRAAPVVAVPSPGRTGTAGSSSAAADAPEGGQAAAPVTPPPPVTLGDVAVIKEANPPLIGDAIINDQPGLLLVVEKLPWANTVQMTQGVEDALESLKPGLPGVHFDPTIFQQANFIELAIHNLTQALVLGFILVVVILGLFLYEWRVALISLLTIPLSLMATMLVLRWMGQTVNTMILAGLVIALGAVVDDAIIDVENIVRRLRQHRRAGGDRASTGRVILEASLEVRSPIVFATLIIVAAAIPVFLLEGVTGAFFRPLALSYTLAIVASMVVAMTLTPALTLILLRNTPIERRESPVVRVLQRGYTRLLSRVIRRPRRTYAGVLAVTALGLVIVPTLGQSLFPHFKEPDFLIHWVTQPGTSDAEMARTTQDVSAKLREIPGLRNFGAHIGQAIAGEEVAGVNLGENWVTIDQSVDYDATLDRITALTKDYPGMFRETQNYLDERIEEVVAQSASPLTVRIYGPDLPVLRDKAAEVNKIMAGIKGTADHHVDISSDVPQVEVEVDLARAAQYQLKPGDVRRAAAALVAGEEVGDIFRGGRAYNTVVWSIPEARDSVQAVQNLMIDTPTGQRVRMADVANITIQPNPNAIDRENGSRKLDVGTNVSGRDLGSVAQDLKQRLAQVDFPRGYHAEIIGEYQERQAAQTRLLTTAGIALAIILLLLQASLGSWRLTGLVFLTLPFALVGGVIAAWGTGGVLSVGSLVGFFTVFGIAARNGILLINHAQHLEREEGEAFGLDLVVRAAKERLAPILMTSLATGLALVPLVVLGNRPGHEIEYPLAVVILGGLLTSTLLNLFVTPVLYLRAGRPRDPSRGSVWSRLSTLPSRVAGRTTLTPTGRTTMSGAHRSSSRARRTRVLVTGVSTALLLAVGPATAATAASSGSSGSSGSGALPCPPLVAFDPGHFHHPTQIDNRFLPMVPGTQHVYTGTTSQGAHQIVSTVTDLTKVVDGVTARVIRETDIQDGQVTEDELTLFAQDDRGNVWNLAEHPELFNAKGKPTGAPDTWVAGLRNAEGGLHMLAHPESQEVRNDLYLQGSAPAIDFLDCARVHSVNGTATVPVGRFSDVLTTYETSPLEQTRAIQTKEHAPSVGIVRVGAINDPEGETLELTSNVVLDPSARSKVDHEALLLDTQGRTTNKVWAKTPPARLG